MRRLLLAFLILPLAGCGDPVGRIAPDVSARPALPPIPADLAPCFAREFPEIPEHGFGRVAAVKIIGDAKLLDRAKAACGERAVSWMQDVTAQFGRPTS